MGDSIGRLLSRRTELFAVMFVVAALNAASHRILGSLDGGFFAASVELFNISAIIWFALFAILKLGIDASDESRAAPRDLAVIAIIVLACLLPSRAPAMLALVAGAAYLLVTSVADSSERRISIIALSLGGPLLLGPLMLNLFGTELLPVDAWLGAMLSGSGVSGNIIQTPEGQVDLLIMPGCSAFNNLTMVVVLAVTLANLLQVRFGKWMAGGIALAAIAVVLVNASRLATMAHFPDHFDWLHNGGGATLFGYATLLVMAPIIAFAVLRSEPRAA